MFPNVLAPSPVYQSMFRAPVSMLSGAQHASLAAAASTSFLVENLLRERHSHHPGLAPHQAPPGLLVAPRPLMTGPHRAPPPPPLGLPAAPGSAPPAASSSAGSPPASPTSPRSTCSASPSPSNHSRGRDSVGVEPQSPRQPSAPTPYLKFGVNAILSSQVSPKNSKLLIFTYFSVIFFSTYLFCRIIYFSATARTRACARYQYICRLMDEVEPVYKDHLEKYENRFIKAEGSQCKWFAKYTLK